jgi:hypothetical protein
VEKDPPLPALPALPPVAFAPPEPLAPPFAIAPPLPAAPLELVPPELTAPPVFDEPPAPDPPPPFDCFAQPAAVPTAKIPSTKTTDNVLRMNYSSGAGEPSTRTTMPDENETARRAQ